MKNHGRIVNISTGEVRLGPRELAVIRITGVTAIGKKETIRTKAKLARILLFGRINSSDRILFTKRPYFRAHYAWLILNATDAHVPARLRVFDGILRQMLVYVNLRFLDDNLQPLALRGSFHFHNNP